MKLRRDEKRFLAITLSPVPSVDGSLLGVACLINDLSELETIRRQQELHGEMSAEMALQLRTSLATIAGYAQQLASNRDPELAQQIAIDIAQEACQSGSKYRRISVDEAVPQKAAVGSPRSMNRQRSGRMQEPGRKTESGKGEAMKRIANMELDLALILDRGRSSVRRSESGSVELRRARPTAPGYICPTDPQGFRGALEEKGFRQRQFTHRKTSSRL